MKATLLHCDILVVGAGPSGLAAAAAARECGADVICLDLFSRAGGQYHMQPASGDSRFQATPQVSQGRAAESRCRELGVRFLLETEIFWAEPGFTVFARQNGDAVTITAAAVIAACGAMERPIPFDGWTLPGVLTAGAAQRLIKANGTLPGRNTVLAGTGPFLLAVASTFAKAGLPLRAYVELQAPKLGLLAPFLRHPSRLPEAVRLLSGVRATGASIHSGHIVTAALGDGRLEAVRMAPVGADGRPQTEKAVTIDGIDALCIGYGFQPVIDFTSLLGAKHHYDTRLGGWACTVEPATQTTDVPGLFAAGETTGIGGAVPARLSGRLAGLSAASTIGKPVAGDTLKTLPAQLAHARHFAATLARLFPFPGHLVEALPQNEVLCRCEDVSRAAITTALDEGADDVFSVKMWTRAGMGPCQGRICGSALSHLVAGHQGTPVASSGYNRPHMPLRPVPLRIADAALALGSPTPHNAGGHQA